MISLLPLWLAFPGADATSLLMVVALVATMILGLAASIYTARQQQKWVIAVAGAQAEHHERDAQVDEFAGMPVDLVPSILRKKRESGDVS